MTPDIKRILVPLDFSANSRRALDYARGLAAKVHADVHLVHVCEVPKFASLGAYKIPYEGSNHPLAGEAARQLQELAATVWGHRTTTEVLFGNPATAIVEAADANRIDLIVMGTHGRSALPHVLMGNVAERVVRHAHCPVLTVREPHAREVVTKSGARRLAAVGAALLAAMLIGPAAAFAQEHATLTQSTPGAEVYRTYCVACHGDSARGDGPLAASMTRKPANLTEIAKRNGGQFPSDLVFRTIDGRQKVRGHGGPDMPEWGEAFKNSREAGDADRVKKVIQSLVDYLESLQLRPAHDQQP
jgi:nucleotide-binding universal stress UspA family protein/mono/diheme cytochrome c family protein